MALPGHLFSRNSQELWDYCSTVRMKQLGESQHEINKLRVCRNNLGKRDIRLTPQRNFHSITHHNLNSTQPVTHMNMRMHYPEKQGLHFLLNFSPVVFLMMLQMGSWHCSHQVHLCADLGGEVQHKTCKSGDPTLVPGSGTVWPAAKARGMNPGKVLAWRRSWGLLESFWRHIKQLGTKGEIKSI